jgi:hypothetical protein
MLVHCAAPSWAHRPPAGSAFIDNLGRIEAACAEQGPFVHRFYRTRDAGAGFVDSCEPAMPLAVKEPERQIAAKGRSFAR